jgi:hypothetical protein
MRPSVIHYLTLLVALLLVAGRRSEAQGTPNWQTVMAMTSDAGGASIQATTTDAAGNVYVVGSFSGYINFGNIQLAGSAGSLPGSTVVNVFVAKWNTTTNTWAWALSARSDNDMTAKAVAVSGGAVYVTGTFYNDNRTNNYPGGSYRVQFGSIPLLGTNSTTSNEIFVARVTDAGNSASWAWAIAAGGSSNDNAYGLSVKGNGIYVSGSVQNNNVTTTYPNGDKQVRFGAIPLLGTSNVVDNDAFVGRVTEDAAGTSAAWAWVLLAGGNGNDYAGGVAVNGDAVYVSGGIANNNVTTTYPGGANNVQFGTIPLPGVSSGSSYYQDAFVARATENTAGTSATWTWALAGGGTDIDGANAIVIHGQALYITGSCYNNNVTTAYPGGANQVQFGTMPLPGASATKGYDAFVARVNENAAGTGASWAWALAGGGTGSDRGDAVFVSGGDIYMGGYVTNNNVTTAHPGGDNQVQFGAIPLPGASGTTSLDALVARASEDAAGTSATWAWALTGGGESGDNVRAVSVSNGTVYAAGGFINRATFGSTSVGPTGTGQQAFLNSIVVSAPLPVELTNFTATAEGVAAVQLRWSTAQEKNSAYFVVERSSDGRTFAAVGQTPAAGTSSVPRSYGWRDAVPSAGTAMWYYRLRQVDTDGSFTYSDVRAVRVGGATLAGLQVYPNPTSPTEVQLTGAAAGASVRVLDIRGRVVLTTTADRAGSARLALPAALPGGVYLVRSGLVAARLVVE